MGSGLRFRVSVLGFRGLGFRVEECCRILGDESGICISPTMRSTPGGAAMPERKNRKCRATATPLLVNLLGMCHGSFMSYSVHMQGSETDCNYGVPGVSTSG